MGRSRQRDVSTAAISAGTIDGTVVGGTNPAAITGTTGAFTSISTTDNIGVGTATAAQISLRVARNISGTTNSAGVFSSGVVQSGVTGSAIYYGSSANTVAASFTLPILTHFNALQGAIGAGSTVTNQYGFAASSTLIGATNNYGFYSNIATGSGRWNFYASGTAANFFAGDLQLGKTVTAAGTTGSRTIDKTIGTVNFAAAATSVMVINSLVSTSSIILCTVGTNDITMKSALAVAGSGSFTIFSNAAATAETRVNFMVVN